MILDGGNVESVKGFLLVLVGNYVAIVAIVATLCIVFALLIRHLFKPGVKRATISIKGVDVEARGQHITARQIIEEHPDGMRRAEWSYDGPIEGLSAVHEVIGFQGDRIGAQSRAAIEGAVVCGVCGDDLSTINGTLRCGSCPGYR
ncbi:hypothetical protein ACGF3J_32080 [Streptomyces sp. NPDC048171]|uniref:hypothetical protein n=1 Tax=Streptomyces sp. NPDC048171 TaxID=3365504 RepID=UPI00371E2F7A